jgi:hypothetical protein
VILANRQEPSGILGYSDMTVGEPHHDPDRDRPLAHIPRGIADIGRYCVSNGARINAVSSMWAAETGLLRHPIELSRIDGRADIPCIDTGENKGFSMRWCGTSRHKCGRG